jgi:RNA polymerase sigma-70 factor (ECF subfamily)
VALGRKPLYYDLDLQESDGGEVFAKLKDIDTPEHLTLSEELRGTIDKAIRDLPEDLRTAILLREIEGMSYEEIAQTMECPVGTVRSRIFRAREAIDKKLKPLLE